VPDDSIESHLKSWDDVFASRIWGRYPPEELVRFISRRFGSVADKSTIQVLDFGCGPGGNLWYLAREGYGIAGIDGSPTAIRQAQERLSAENSIEPGHKADLQVGNFAKLPWDSNCFDVVIDIEAIAANQSDVIRDALSEVHRVLKPGGVFFGKMFGRETTGYDAAQEFEPGTLHDPKDGPCTGMDVAHFFSEAELNERLASFSSLKIDWVKRSDRDGSWSIQEWLVTAEK